MTIRSLTIRNEDDDDILRDGERFRVPLEAMDGVQRAVAGAQHALHDGMGNPAGYKPGYVFSDDQDALARSEEAYCAYNERVTAAWRQEKPSPQDKPSAPETTGDALADARAQYVNRLTNAWRRP
jgi:hypothetical protein